MKFSEALELVMKEERDFKDGETGLLVLDIDDTLLKANPNVIKVYKSINGVEKAISTAEFAKDPDKAKMGKNVKMYKNTEDAPKHGIAFSIREFRDPQKVYDSITKGTPIIKNLKLMDDHIRHGWDVSFLTARGLQKVVTKALDDFLRTRTKDGNLVPLGDSFKKALSAAVNDEDIKYAGSDDGEKKANVLRELSKKYTKVKFVDDDDRNINAVRSLRKELPNVKAVKAHGGSK
jgi:hypothetical protein